MHGIAGHPVWGNFATGDSLTRLLRLVHQGAIAGCLTRPLARLGQRQDTYNLRGELVRVLCAHQLCRGVATVRHWHSPDGQFWGS